jgi:Domain of unknown function (DUF5092)
MRSDFGDASYAQLETKERRHLRENASWFSSGNTKSNILYNRVPGMQPSSPSLQSPGPISATMGPVATTPSSRAYVEEPVATKGSFETGPLFSSSLQIKPSSIQIKDVISKEKPQPQITGLSALAAPRLFLRFVGVPPKKNSENAEELVEADVDTVVVHSVAEPLPPEIVLPPRLSPISAARHLVDIIDSDNEDPFTLDTYRDMLKACVVQQKDLVLARVTTLDPTDETRYYNSYYIAHHINKVLFRTQPEEGLLHRMRARNV